MDTEWSDFNWWQKLLAVSLIAAVITVGMFIVTFVLALLIHVIQLQLQLVDMLL